MNEEKFCAWCGVTFQGGRRRKYCSGRCKRAPWAAAHRSQMLEYWRERYYRNRAKESERARQWYRANHKRALDSSRAWTQRNPDGKRAKDVRRRARELGASGSWTGAEWRLVLERCGDRCYYCGAVGDLTVDHKVPLARGGSNHIDNLVPACRSCNSRKGTQDELEYLAVLALDAFANGRQVKETAAARETWPLQRAV